MYWQLEKASSGSMDRNKLVSFLLKNLKSFSLLIALPFLALLELVTVWLKRKKMRIFHRRKRSKDIVWALHPFKAPASDDFRVVFYRNY